MRIIIVLIMVWCLSAGACPGNKHVEQQKMVDFPQAQNLERVYVSGVEVLATNSADSTVELQVKGNLPSPAYLLERIETRVSDGNIEITPLARVEQGRMATQVLVPFQKKVTLKLVKPGEYSVKLLGRGETRTTTLHLPY